MIIIVIYFRTPEKKKDGLKPETFKYVVKANEKTAASTVSFKMIR
jgi:hypothetical protein